MNINTGYYASLTMNMMSGYSAINGMKAQLALGAKTADKLNAGYSLSGSTLNTGAMNFLKDYRQKLGDMQAAAKNVLSPKAAVNRYAAASDKATVATVTGNLKSTADRYTLKVEQTARDQINRSAAVRADAALPTMGGALRIQTDKGVFNLNLSSAGSKTNSEALNQFAEKINAAASGVTASVVKKEDGTAFLELSGTTDFAVSGSFAQSMGLEAVYEAQRDAVFTVTKNGEAEQRLTSATNRIEIDGLSVELKGIGSAQIKAGQSEADRVADATGRMVDSFNSLLSTLNANADRGIGVLRQVRRMVLPPASEQSMATVGITIAKDGSLAFDRSRFVSAMEKDPTAAKSVIDRVARGIEDDATAGLREPSASLVGQLTASGGVSADSYNMETVNFLSSYNRSGIFNTMNLYAAGALLNISV